MAAVNNSDIPAGWAVDGQGQVTTKPKTAMREGAGLPLGGQVKKEKSSFNVF